MPRFAKSARALALCFVLLNLSFPIASAQSEPFTVQADADLQPAAAALYGALYPGAEPAFVDAGGDVLATADAEALAAAYDGLPAYFLPGAGLVPLTDNADALAFIDFAVSADGQEALIAAGFLSETVTITDQGGNEVVLPQPVRRIVSPYAIGTYYVYTVGAQESLVAANFLGGGGVENMARIDPRASEISSVMVMSQREINVEEAAAQEPDVILASTRTAWIDAIRELQIPLVLYEGETLEALKESVLLTGQFLGPNATARAEAWVVYYDSILAAIAEKTGALAEADRVKVLFTGTEPLRVASGDMYQTAMIEVAGGVSVSAELAGFWNDVNLEQILVWDPDVILVPSYGGASVEAITDSPEWQALDAVQEGRVYQLPQFTAPLDTPVPDSVIGIIWMAQTLYPDLVDLDCAVEARYFYATWYDYAMSDEEAAALCGP